MHSHSMPIELGRWNGTKRNLRICKNCKVLGDEKHFIYECPTVNRAGLNDIPSLNKLSNYEKLLALLKNLSDEIYL